MNYSFQPSRLNDHTLKFKILADQSQLSYREVIELLIHSNAFKSKLTQVLCQLEFEGFFWEVKPVTQQQINNAFEFVVVQGNLLSRLKADSSHFQAYFTKDARVVSFYNLGRDAKLVVPCALGQSTNYAHLANFLRTGEERQIQEFWTEVGKNYKEMIGEEKLWLSTAGLGVHWLHIRLDKRPKYYRHKPYK